MPKVLHEKIISTKKLAPEIYKIKFQSEYIALHATPGQFVNVKCQEGYNALLRRPISICDVDRINHIVEIVFRVHGTGTEYLAQKIPGTYLDVIGPLGNPFDASITCETIAVVGGGIGIFPLLFLLQNSKAKRKIAYLGFRSKEQMVLLNRFKLHSDELYIATNDGSFGEQGTTLDIMNQHWKEKKFDVVYGCGPTPMLEALAKKTEQNGVLCQLSLEQRMGCGIGACKVCACKTKAGDDYHYSQVCKDGPVFWAQDLLWDE